MTGMEAHFNRRSVCVAGVGASTLIALGLPAHAGATEIGQAEQTNGLAPGVYELNTPVAAGQGPAHIWGQSGLAEDVELWDFTAAGIAAGHTAVIVENVSIALDGAQVLNLGSRYALGPSVTQGTLRNVRFLNTSGDEILHIKGEVSFQVLQG